MGRGLRTEDWEESAFISVLSTQHLSLASLDVRELLLGVDVARRLEAAADEGVGDALLLVHVDLDLALRRALEGGVLDEAHGLRRVRSVVVREDDLQDRAFGLGRAVLRGDEPRRGEEDHARPA